jgi:hypothetical protein
LFAILFGEFAEECLDSFEEGRFARPLLTHRQRLTIAVKFSDNASSETMSSPASSRSSGTSARALRAKAGKKAGAAASG